MSILLVRHGETEGNRLRVLQQPETPLSDRGKAQAQRLGERLAAQGVAAILASDYARARMTAEAVRSATGAPLELDAGLRERNFGALRGRAYADLDVDPFAVGYSPPGGESWEELHARVDSVWERVARAVRDPESNLVVVTHGLVCHSLVTRHLQLAAGLDYAGGFANTALTVIEPLPPWRVRVLGCTAHLDAATAHDPGSKSGL